MPRYKGQLVSEDAGPNEPVIHVFDYSANDNQPPSRSSYRKQLVAVDSCIYLRRRNLADIKSSKSRAPRSGAKAWRGGAKGSMSGARTSESESKASEGGATVSENWADVKEGGGLMNNVGEAKTRGTSESEDDFKRGGASLTLEAGHEFEGYVLKCPNGPYDYAIKLWDEGKAAPQEEQYPRPGEEVEALVIDRNGDFLTVACGSNIAYATRKSFLIAGVDPDDLSLPFSRLRVSLSRAEKRPREVPAAAWVAHPTQVNIPPYDIY
ncbi:uncharacterized protein [Panulirus ornatus]|uniref:uncharacterized protein n=1 Tax=Panulirus ornatus TaxID=150431 RepID=UPI003A8532B0